MEKRVEQKINEIQNYIDELSPIIPASLEEYEQDLIKRSASERYFEKIMATADSLAFIIIKQKCLPFPENETSSYLILSENYILNEDLGLKLSELAQMKKMIVDPDEFIEDAEVYRLLNEELVTSVSTFLETLRQLI